MQFVPEDSPALMEGLGWKSCGYWRPSRKHWRCRKGDHFPSKIINRCGKTPWNWPRKMYSSKLEISSSLTHWPVQKQADCYTVTSNVIGSDYRSTLSTRRW